MSGNGMTGKRSSINHDFKQLVQLCKLQPEEWSQLAKGAMNEDFSWEKIRTVYFRFFDQIEEGLIVK
ncbi:glycogen synthase [Pedobacter sp. UYP1]|jgi:glycogen synthase